MVLIPIPSFIIGAFIGKKGIEIKNFSSKFPHFDIQIFNEDDKSFVEIIPKKKRGMCSIHVRDATIKKIKFLLAKYHKAQEQKSHYLSKRYKDKKIYMKNGWTTTYVIPKKTIKPRKSIKPKKSKKSRNHDLANPGDLEIPSRYGFFGSLMD